MQQNQPLESANASNSLPSQQPIIRPQRPAFRPGQPLQRPQRPMQGQPLVRPSIRPSGNFAPVSSGFRPRPNASVQANMIPQSQNQNQFRPQIQAPFQPRPGLQNTQPVLSAQSAPPRIPQQNTMNQYQQPFNPELNNNPQMFPSTSPQPQLSQPQLNQPQLSQQPSSDQKGNGRRTSSLVAPNAPIKAPTRRVYPDMQPAPGQLPPYSETALFANIQPAGIPQMNAPQAFLQPQFQQQGFSQPVGAMAIPGVQQNAGFQQQHQPDGLQNAMSANFGNMNLAAPSSLAPVPINLMAVPPQMAAITQPCMVPKVNIPSATPSPYANANPSYKRCTMNAIPQNPQLFNKSCIPFGLLVTPYRQLQDGDEAIPVVNSPIIVRCRRCRTYINPWVQFIDQGARWKCNVCNLSNEVPSFFDWDSENRNRVDRMTRPELTHGIVEYVAPQEYMVRPPQPVVMLFVIDVSYGAVQSGMVAVAAKTILDSLTKIPDFDGRAKIGFIFANSAMHYINLGCSLTEPKMMVVSDLQDPYLPMPYDLLVTLSECRPMVEAMLEKLPSLFLSSNQTNSALGVALKCAQKMIGSIGGKIIILQHSLPNVGEGALKSREDPKLFGSAKESILLVPSIPFYKAFALECSPAQISVDLFLFNGQYADVATLSTCTKFTSGNVYYYKNFTAADPADVSKFSSELSHMLARPLGLVAVLRIRSSNGIKMSAFHGNLFLRSADLLSLPNANADNCYAVEMHVVEPLTCATVCFQTALLHTNTNGERRIRVLTLVVPVTSNMAELYQNVDQFAVAALLGKKAVERSLVSKLEDAREALVYKLVEILHCYKTSFYQASNSQQLLIADNLNMLPLLILGMIKSIAFRSSSKIPSDLRSFMLCIHYVFCPEWQITNFCPRFWNLSELVGDAQVKMAEQIGLPDLDGKIVYPTLLNLSSEKLDQQGVFLLDNGLELLIWVGSKVQSSLLGPIFGQESIGQIRAGKTTLPIVQTDSNARLHNLINDIRKFRLKQSTIYPPLYIVSDVGDPAIRIWFLSHLIEDRLDSSQSYPQFLADVREKLQNKK